MGGGFGGGLSSYDISSLEEIARKRIQQANQVESPHIFISFAAENLNDVNLLRGQAKNENTDLNFDDHSVKEPYNSENTDYIKQKIREKLDRCSVTVVYLTSDSAQSEWVNWEISESIKKGKGVIGLYKGDTVPSVLPQAFSDNNCKAVKWKQEKLMDAIIDASEDR